MKNTQRSPDGMHGNSLSSARPPEDNSVAFSLSALMALEASATAPAAGAEFQGADRNESGLIDLAALRSGTASAHSHYLEVFPFGVPAPEPPIPAADPERATPKRARMPFQAALLLIAAAAAGTGGALHRSRAPIVLTHAETGLSEALRTLPATTPLLADSGRPLADADLAARSETTQDSASKDSTAVLAQRRASPERSRAGQADAAHRDRAAVAQREKATKRVPATDPCNGDLTCAMRRAASGG